MSSNKTRLEELRRKKKMFEEKNLKEKEKRKEMNRS